MTDAIVLYGDTLRHPNLLWRTGFSAPDPFMYVEAGDRQVLLVGAMEYGRAKKEARVQDVRMPDEAEWRRRQEANGDADANAAAIAEVLRELGAETARVEPDFPVAMSRALEQHDIAVEVDADLFRSERRRKTAPEQEAIARTQAATVASMRVARGMLAEAEVRDGKLWHDGQPLTSDRVIAAIEQELLRHNCGTDSTIVASGPRAADPHCSNSGHLDANTGVIIDIYPMDKGSRYFGDMTRTYVVGEPTEKWLQMYDAVKSAHERALSMLRAGVTGREVHDAVCQTLYDAGFGVTVDGFRRDGVPIMNHGTGHGVGLEIHEPPRINASGGALMEGDVVTIEPGLYSETEGSLRLENTVVVTADGYRELTDMDLDWRP